ncbi:hypothetical protein TOK_5948 [Pseudonocardia sp. N23]|nr:hypothetical protein TOK_5948 [Pseudonocardia sp. N23]
MLPAEGLVRMVPTASGDRQREPSCQIIPLRSPFHSRVAGPGRVRRRQGCPSGVARSRTGVLY